MANGYKTGGRKAGVRNKNTALITAMCDYIIESGYEKFKAEFDKLEGKQYVECFLKLAKISTDGGNKIRANEKIIEFFNQKLKQNGINQ